MEKDYRSLEQKIRDVITESHDNRNTELRKKVVNVARPNDADPTSEKSKLAKQSEIKTKIIDEEKDEDKNKKAESEKDDDKKKSKGGASKAEDEFTGGKTEVDTEPKTDDKVNDESSEKKKGDKETKKVNKEIGAKGAGAVKEESSMFGTKKNFGLPESLIAAVSEAMKTRIEVKKEELKGDQHKIDKNKNGKIDAHDFKLLKKEEVELDELSKGTLGSYVKKASSDMADKLRSSSEFADKSAAVKKQMKRGNYNNYGRGAEAEKNMDKEFGGYVKRERGITKAVGKLTKEEVQFSEEEIARIEEIAKGL